jgi:hypothetical protein
MAFDRTTCLPGLPYFFKDDPVNGPVIFFWKSRDGLTVVDHPALAQDIEDWKPSYDAFIASDNAAQLAIDMGAQNAADAQQAASDIGVNADIGT